MKYRYDIFLLIICVVMLTGCIQSNAQSQFKADYDWVLPNFSFINQNEEVIGLSTMKGQVWLANFVFTNCDTVCPPMTANIVKLRKQLAENNIEITINSFTVDPERDSPDALKTFASKFGTDLSNWNLLTGYKQEEVKKLAKSFKTLAEAEEGTDQFTHSTKIYLINQEGIIVKGYDGLNVPFEEIIVDLKAIQSEQ